ncbi:hypothetical protein [Miltoncostaea oceani]|uniref:hypothetical protein n=1 Tax=Miltoncostaea oceani TaxID=2843216 RepID=UPI001C3E70B7|nr:hypothetical protein [Miltoncostaea oceani]
MTADERLSEMRRLLEDATAVTPRLGGEAFRIHAAVRAALQADEQAERGTTRDLPPSCIHLGGDGPEACPSCQDPQAAEQFMADEESGRPVRWHECQGCGHEWAVFPLGRAGEEPDPRPIAREWLAEHIYDITSAGDRIFSEAGVLAFARQSTAVRAAIIVELETTP